MLYTKNKFKLFFIFLIIAIVVQLISSWIVNLYAPDTFDPIMQRYEKSEQFIWLIQLVIIAPLIETFIFQFLCVEFILYIGVSIPVAIGVSSVFFALAHPYNVNYILLMIPAGIIYALYYTKLREESKLLAYLSVCGIHFAENLLGYFVNYA